MAVDFPNNPAVNELFFAEGTTWKWTGAAWAVVGSEGTPVEIVEADVSQGWQVWGDTLIQWGVATPVNGGVAVTFPKAFKTVPKVTTAITGLTPGGLPADGLYSVMAETPFVNSVTFRERYVNSTSGVVADVPFSWIAIGEAPDALKKPKVVQTIGGADVQEYLDPTGVGSWRLIGDNLEMWGTTAAGLSQGVLTFPKRFKPGTVPMFSCSVAATTPQLKVVNFNGVEGGITDPYKQLFVYVRDGAGSTTGQVSWHARGIWDGVS